MASASDFLKKRTAARQQAESIQSSDKTPLGKNDDGTVTRASNFLRNKAAERRAVIDQQYGKDAYGGSGRYEADKAQGFNSWLESVNGLSSQLGSDYQSRDGKFQSAADFGKYRDDNDARISVMHSSWYRSSSSLPLITAYLSSKGRYMSKMLVMASWSPPLARRSICSNVISVHPLDALLQLPNGPVIHRGRTLIR